MSASNHYQLKHPIQLIDEHGNVTSMLTEVSMQRLKGRDLGCLDAAKGGMARTKALIAVSCRVLPMHVDEMDAEDIMALGERVSDFLGQSRTTGEA